MIFGCTDMQITIIYIGGEYVFRKASEISITVTSRPCRGISGVTFLA